jgi:hypothetical protein
MQIWNELTVLYVLRARTPFVEQRRLYAFS